ncbi:MAG: UDP-N-acetylmuramate dehydrogenase [Mariniphaga sp.]|nr:UDP-N-acetylmuramate dehydrogenase [Mariniphaga sp.]MDD4224876.1 UDP-N-acetylmuramate dehydrogenase [Mariniphaga sp.]MDD4426755.1 UDP-N-acetylmuramate dehydrogenase [Mariniphaga sp.]
MIRFFENYNLKPHNTFGVKVKARYFFEFTEPDDLDIFIQANEGYKDLPLLLIGSGSNILFLQDFSGLVIHPNVPGIIKVKEDRSHVWLEVGAGETWDDFVGYCVENILGGVENLSLIPGKVGAAPVQNIGAYGQEVSQSVESVKGYDLQKKVQVEYHAEDCAFGYRNSLFKTKLKNRFVITSVVFKLDKFPEFNLEYGYLKEKVREAGEVSLQQIRKTIIAIRSAKLPDVSTLGNAGSFFKNPSVSPEEAERMKQIYADIPIYPVNSKSVKLAAGWLIEKAGLKGYREGQVGVHEKQALVLVNYGDASGKEIFDFSEKIRQTVLERFNIELEREVNCI